jgi:hypothetical protein
VINLKRASLALVLLVGGVTAKADTILTYVNFDTRAGGSYSVDANSADGNGSLKLSTAAVAPIGGVNQDKVAVLFTNGTALGTLNELTGIGLQAYKSSSPATGAASDFAYRIQFANGNSLVYENAYNGSAAVALDTWRDLDLFGGKFWLYDGVNHNGGGDEHALSYYSGTLGSQQIVGLQVAYGSGLGAFTGYVDNVHLDFGAQVANGPISTPLPSAALGGLACLGMFGISKRSRRTA